VRYLMYVSNSLDSHRRRSVRILCCRTDARHICRPATILVEFGRLLFHGLAMNLIYASHSQCKVVSIFLVALSHHVPVVKGCI
jgi:hypothetical protein